MEIKIAKNEAEILACYGVMKQLRPHLIEDKFVSDVQRMQTQGYVLAYLKDVEVRAVAGYRIMEMFATGKNFYVDDLVTDSNCRSKGYGKTLLNWLIDETSRLNCRFLDLDSGSKRINAHRFYRKNGLEEIALHFSIPTNGRARWSENLVPS